MHSSVRIFPYRVRPTLEAQILVRFALRLAAFQDTRLLNIGNAPNVLRITLKYNGQKYPVYTKYIEAHSLVRSALRPEIQGCRKPKYTEWCQSDVKHVNVKSTLYTLRHYPRGSNFEPFGFTTRPFLDTSSLLSKIGNIGYEPNDLTPALDI